MCLELNPSSKACKSDTPAQPLVKITFTDTKAEPGKKHSYRVIAVNTEGLKSK